MLDQAWTNLSGSVVLLLLSHTASHIEYLVSTRSQLPGWSAPEVSVRRRFRDFVALAELLKVSSGEALPGHHSSLQRVESAWSAARELLLPADPAMHM
jgi:hypothetical protein